MEAREIPVGSDGAAFCPFCGARTVKGAPVCRHYDGHDDEKGVVRFVRR